MRILVTGSAGFIGGATVAELVRRGHELLVFDRPMDVRDAHQVRPFVAQADAVIHLAGALGTAELFGSERDAADVNILGALTVADECARRGIPMVWIGTGHKGQPNPYAITKGCAEDLLLARGNVAVVRAYHAYGPGQKVPPPHGTAHVRKIIPSFVCRALTGMPIEVWGEGHNVIDLVHVDEVARILVDAIDLPPGCVYEAGTGVGLTVDNVARRVVEMCRSTSEVVHLPMRPGEPEGAVVVASEPLALHPFPFGMGDVIDHYADVVSGWMPALSS